MVLKNGKQLPKSKREIMKNESEIGITIVVRIKGPGI